MQMSTQLILPILNRNIVTFKGPSWYLSNNVAIETLTANVYKLIYDHPHEFAALVKPETKCIRIDNVELQGADTVAKAEAMKTSFILNFFRKKHPVALFFAAKIITKRKARLDSLIDLSVVGDVMLQKKYAYKVREEATRVSISDFYKVLDKAHCNHNKLLLTLDRFNTALCRTNIYDQIIDISICLESLIRGTSELRQRFAIHNAWAAESVPNQRQKAYKLLCDLYDARSAIVHGTNEERKITSVTKKWENILRIASNAIAYYVLYLYNNSVEQWYEHQKRLVLGLDQRITQG